VVAGCAHSPPSEVASPMKVEPGLGYSQKGDVVTFQFNPSEFEDVTADQTGEWRKLATVTIDDVHVAGEFNGWSKTEWPMVRSGSRWTLSKKKSELGSADTYQFKFVVNGNQWVEPPKRASNQAGTGFVNNASNLVMVLK